MSNASRQLTSHASCPMPHASCLTACLSALAEQIVASPLVVKRFRHRIDSDVQRFGLFEASKFHFCARQEVDGADGDGIGLILLDDRAKRRLGLGEVAPLIGAERLAVVAGCA